MSDEVAWKKMMRGSFAGSDDGRSEASSTAASVSGRQSQKRGRSSTFQKKGGPRVKQVLRKSIGPSVG